MPDFFTHLLRQPLPGDLEWSLKVCRLAPVVGKPVSKEEVKNQLWASWSGILGSEVSGIWPKYSDSTAVHAVGANHAAAVLITGDDLGLVKLFRFPCLKKGLHFVLLPYSISPLVLS